MSAADNPLCDMTPEVAQMTEELAFKFSRAPHWPARYAQAVIAYESLTAMFDAAKAPGNPSDTRCMAMCVVSMALAHSHGLSKAAADPRQGTAGSA